MIYKGEIGMKKHITKEEDEKILLYSKNLAVEQEVYYKNGSYDYTVTTLPHIRNYWKQFVRPLFQ